MNLISACSSESNGSAEEHLSSGRLKENDVYVVRVNFDVYSVVRTVFKARKHSVRFVGFQGKQHQLCSRSQTWPQWHHILSMTSTWLNKYGLITFQMEMLTKNAVHFFLYINVLKQCKPAINTRLISTSQKLFFIAKKLIAFEKKQTFFTSAVSLCVFFSAFSKALSLILMRWVSTRCTTAAGHRQMHEPRRWRPMRSVHKIHFEWAKCKARTWSRGGHLFQAAARTPRSTRCSAPFTEHRVQNGLTRFQTQSIYSKIIKYINKQTKKRLNLGRPVSDEC